MPGISDQSKKKKLLALLANPKFHIKVVEFRIKWGIPNLGFTDVNEEYGEWVLGHIEYEESIRHDFEMITKRAIGLYGKNDPIFTSLISLYFLFNKFPSSYPSDLHLPIMPKFRASGVLGYVDLVLPLPLFFNNADIDSTIQSSEGLISGVESNIVSSISLIRDTPPEPLTSNEINGAFLSTPPGNPHDIIAKTQEYTEWLVEFGIALLHESVAKIKDPQVIKYQDKNIHINRNIQRIGEVLSNRGLYSITELFWKNITHETDVINNKKSWKLNRGISLANTGVYQIVQGKVDEGLFNLYRALHDDKSVLEKLNDLNPNPELNIVSTILFTQFEKPLLEWTYHNILVLHKDLVNRLPGQQALNDYVASLSPDLRLYLFDILWHIKQGLDHSMILPNFIDRGKLISKLGSLCLWTESMMHRKTSQVKGLFNLLSFFKFPLPNGFSPSSSTLDELISKINLAIKIGSKDQSNGLVLLLIRNFTGHNFDSQDHDFFAKYDEYLARILFTILLASTKGKI